MSLVGQWQGIERSLPPAWAEARLELKVAESARSERAAALLGPAQPYRSSRETVRFAAARDGSAPGPDAIRRLLARLDGEGVRGSLALVDTAVSDRAPAPAPESLVGSWRAALATLPSDWSDLYAELELLSSDYLERAALLTAPLNPRRDGERTALRFRCAARFGYGASRGMVERCLDRCDAEQMRGSVRILRALSDTKPVATQGPVWQLDGRTI